MKKIIFTLAMMGQLAAFAANSLLQNPATGTITLPANSLSTTIAVIANNTDVVLAIGTQGAIYMVDIADNNTGEATANTITSIPNFVTAKLNAAAGTTITYADMAVNPKSKSVYVLGTGANGTTYIFKVKNNGASVTVLPLTNVSHCKINLAAGTTASALTWGNNTLYASATSGTGTTLAAEVDWMAAPFAHNSTFTKRSTSLYKSNWGNAYMTNAPLEKMAFGKVGDKNRLMGVTTCAPGYAIDITNLTGTGALQITEDFNVANGSPEKVVAMTHDGKTWLYNLHDRMNTTGILYRIGEKFLNGSQVAGNHYNANATMLRMGTNPATGLTENEFKLVNDKVNGIAYWEDGKMLILDPPTVNGGALRLLTVGTATGGGTGIAAINNNGLQLSLSPNPASGLLNVDFHKAVKNATLTVTAIDGRTLMKKVVNGSNIQLDIHTLPAGTYTLTADMEQAGRSSSRFVVK